MQHTFIIDHLLPSNLTTTLYITDQDTLTEQREILAIAFEQKIRYFTKDKLLALKFYIKTYLDLKPGADADLYRTYLFLINIYLKKGNR